MNNAKIWLVVPPAVGVPVFLGAVAVGSFATHVAVVSNTSWVDDFISGQPLGTGDEMAAAEQKLENSTAKAAYELPMEDGKREILVTFSDGTTARAVLQPNEVLASSSTLPLR